MRARHLILLALCSSPSAWARLKVLPTFPANGYVPAGESILRYGKLGSSVELLTGTAEHGGTSIGFTGMVPLSFGDSHRSSGWFASIAGTYRPQLASETAFVQTTHQLEVSAGRGIDFLAGSNTDTGLRGYFDVSLRDTRPTFESLTDPVLAAAGFRALKNNLAIGIRIGASTDPAGSGLVAQPPSRYALRVQTALYVPTQAQGYIFFSSVQGDARLLDDWLRGGLFVDLTRFGKLHEAPTASEPTYGFSYGLELELSAGKRYRLQMDLGTSFLAYPDENSNPLIPFAKTTLSVTY